MSEITTAVIMDLRARTNAGMMDCKRALHETQGNMEEAIKLLRLKGLAIQVKRADKEAKQGIVQSAGRADASAMALVEVNCETDFVAKTEGFRQFVAEVAAKVLAGDEQVAESMKEQIVNIVAATGESVRIRRVARFERAGHGIVESYIHMGGKVGVLVEVSCGKAETMAHPVFVTLVHDIALQCAAAAPRWLKADEVPADVLESEKSIYRQDPKLAGKPAKIVENAMIGKVKKFYGESCLVNQVFVKDDKLSIAQLVEATARQVADSLTIRRFARFQLGAA